ncbi:MAG TPA: hypothetical protein VIG80_13205, partial [Bacillaceae bacterium]
YNRKPAESGKEIGLHTDLITSSEWQVLIYNNYSNWSYKEGTQFGMPVYHIEGTIPSSTSNNLAGPFTMTVAKETGALLDLKCYGNEGNPILSIDVKDITINQGISDDIFVLDVSGDHEVSNYEFNMRGIEDSEEKTGGVKTNND